MAARAERDRLAASLEADERAADEPRRAPSGGGRGWTTAAAEAAARAELAAAQTT